MKNKCPLRSAELQNTSSKLVPECTEVTIKSEPIESTFELSENLKEMIWQLKRRGLISTEDSRPSFVSSDPSEDQQQENGRDYQKEKLKSLEEKVELCHFYTKGTKGCWRGDMCGFVHDDEQRSRNISVLSIYRPIKHAGDIRPNGNVKFRISTLHDLNESQKNFTNPPHGGHFFSEPFDKRQQKERLDRGVYDSNSGYGTTKKYNQKRFKRKFQCGPPANHKRFRNADLFENINNHQQ